MSEKPRMELSATQVVGGALAAASAAVAASVFGVYGTIIGAVVVSIVTSVGGAIYTHSFRRGREAITKVRVNRTERFAATPGGSTKDTPAADDTTSVPATRTGWRTRLAGINPRTVAITAACVLAISLGAITGIEAMIDKPISSAVGGGGDKGGNSLGRAFDGRSGGEDGDRSPSPTPTATVTTTKSPTATSTGEPTTGPSKPATSTSTGEPTTSKPTTSRPTLPPTSTKQPSTQLPTGGASKEAQQAP
ncbi:MAG: hypothetical protein GEV10_27370 [Streptosporangiales bacterium]|nr:hypothetical protein [Streptosporangiales bacterium]